MNEQAISTLISVLLSGFISWWVARYTVKRSEGKLRILRLEFDSVDRGGASLTAIMVNEGQGDIVVDWVLLRDQHGEEEKQRPGWEKVSSSRDISPLGSTWRSPKRLAARERLEFAFNLAELVFSPQDIKEFEAIETTDKRHTKKLSRQLRRGIEAWCSSKPDNSNTDG
jgi:hypothetical protein